MSKVIANFMMSSHGNIAIPTQTRIGGARVDSAVLLGNIQPLGLDDVFVGALLVVDFQNNRADTTVYALVKSGGFKVVERAELRFSSEFKSSDARTAWTHGHIWCGEDAHLALKICYLYSRRASVTWAFVSYKTRGQIDYLLQLHGREPRPDVVRDRADMEALELARAERLESKVESGEVKAWSWQARALQVDPAEDEEVIRDYSIPVKVTGILYNVGQTGASATVTYVVDGVLGCRQMELPACHFLNPLVEQIGRAVTWKNHKIDPDRWVQPNRRHAGRGEVEAIPTGRRLRPYQRTFEKLLNLWELLEEWIGYIETEDPHHAPPPHPRIIRIGTVRIHVSVEDGTQVEYLDRELVREIDGI